MTKEIIINKVDVSKCKYFGGFGTECLKQDLMLSCDEHQNCKYKQIKREKKADKYKQALNKIKARIHLKMRMIVCLTLWKLSKIQRNLR